MMHSLPSRPANGLHNGPKHITGLHFACDRSWESMAPMEGGRFCDDCQKPVIDFTTWSKQELQTWFRSGGSGCGRYEAHQLDPSLVPIEEVGRGVRRGLFAAIAAFAIGSVQAQEVEPTVPTEQVDSLSRKRDMDVNARIAVENQNPKLDHGTCPPITPPPSRKERKNVYVSWRFPFVHVKPRHHMGRIRRQKIIF